MYRMILIVAFALVVGSGAVAAVAQSGGTQALTQAEAEEAGIPEGCATPIASPGASPEVFEVAVGEVTPVVSLAASPEASPVATEICATPEGDVPAQ